MAAPDLAIGAPGPRPTRTEALAALALIPLRGPGRASDTALALTVTAIAILVFSMAGVALHVLSYTLYRRTRPLVFASSTTRVDTPGRRLLESPVVQAILMLLGLVIAALIIGVPFGAS